VLVREEDFYTALGDVHDAMLWLGAQLRVHLVLGNTWPLQVVSSGLGSLVECASCGSYGEVSDDCLLQCI